MRRMCICLGCMKRSSKEPKCTKNKTFTVGHALRHRAIINYSHFGGIVGLVAHERDADQGDAVKCCLIHAVAASMTDKGLHRGVPQYIILGCPADKFDVGRLKRPDGHVPCT